MNDKAQIRQYFKQIRANMTCDEVLFKSKSMCDILLSDEIYKACKCIMLYMPLGKEADTTSIIGKAYDDGKRVVFPVTDGNNGAITPVYAQRDTSFIKGAFSVMVPDSEDIAEAGDIDVILVPGVAFDRKGCRIGFGKGCYDRLLSGYNGIKVGFCYSEQMCESIPKDRYDVCMDYIITQDGIIDCREIL